MTTVRAAADHAYQVLNDALLAGKLPAEAAETSKGLLARLRDPMRVTLMGFPQSGKSTLVNLLLNDTVVPEGISLPTTQYVRGATPKAELTLSDGRVETIADVDPYQISAAAPMYVEVALPLAALGRINVLEIVAPITLQDQQRAMHWAAKRTDLALWCTDGFNTNEQALWDTMPDAIKDHAFMLLTRADQALARGDLEETLTEVRENHAYQFNKILPIATTNAIAARNSDGTVDKAMMQASGGTALISAILRQVDSRLQATVDQAQVMIETYKDAIANPAPAPAPQQTNIVEMKSAQPLRVAESSAKFEPHPDVKSRLLAFEPSRPAVIPAPAAQAPAAPAPEPKKQRPGFMPKARGAAAVPRAKPETCDAYLEAIAYLSKQGRALSQDVAKNEDFTPNDLMTASLDTIMWLSDYLEDLTISDDPVLEKARTRALDASELVQLMQIERNESAALDALTLVIQLKRDLESEIALSRHDNRNKAA